MPFDPFPGPYWPSLSPYMSLSALSRFVDAPLNGPGQTGFGNKDRWFSLEALV